MNWTGPLTTALADVVSDFSGALAVVIPITFGLAALGLVYRRIKGTIR